jgi:hypothetical protein
LVNLETRYTEGEFANTLKEEEAHAIENANHVEDLQKMLSLGEIS